MQNRYVGDVGDYGKYALLRSLCGTDRTRPVRLGVAWCLFPDEMLGNDGKHISYLKDLKFAELDADLHAALAAIVSADQRNVSAIGEYGCLPATTVFFSQPISTAAGKQSSPGERIRQRKIWLQACLHQTKE